MNKNFVAFVFAIVFFACCKGTAEKPVVDDEVEAVAEGEREDSIESAKSKRDSVSPESLMHWCNDEILKVNPELVELLDTLYQHVRAEHFPQGMRTEERWMARYRRQVCRFYDRHSPKKGAVSEYEKAYWIMDEAERLFMKNTDWSTMGWVIHNSFIRTINSFREYTVLSHMVSDCSNKGEKSLIYKELEACQRVTKMMQTVICNLGEMCSWGGSFSSVAASCGTLQVAVARVDVYRNLVEMKYKDSVQNGKNTLFSSYSKHLYERIDVATKKMESYLEYEGANSRFYDERHRQMFVETLEETKRDVRTLKRQMTAWEKMVLGRNYIALNAHCNVERTASIMLREWANAVNEYSEL